MLLEQPKESQYDQSEDTEIHYKSAGRGIQVATLPQVLGLPSELHAKGSRSSQGEAHQRNCAFAPTTSNYWSGQIRDLICGRRG